MTTHTFCRFMLAAVRREASSDQRRLSSTWGVLNSGTRHRPYYVVEGDRGYIVWEGSACCRSDARYNAFVRILDTAAKDTCAAMVKGDKRDAKLMTDFMMARERIKSAKEKTPLEWVDWRNYYVRAMAGTIIHGYVEVAV